MRRSLVKVLGITALVLAVLLAGGYLFLLRSVPETRGTLHVNGISGQVDIVRDSNAVPHIFATTRQDGLFGLGYTHAQDRLWQMEFQRRIGHGRLSEVLGSATIRQDRFLRTVGFGRAAVSAWEHLPQDARDQVDAYLAGVNAFIQSTPASRLPPEFTILGFRPEPFTGPDVVVWAKMMAWDLSANYTLELMRHDVAARVGPERMRELFPPYPTDGLNILPTVPPELTLGTPPAATPGQTEGTAGRAVVADLIDSYAGAWTSALSSSTHPFLDRFLLGGGGATEGLGSNNWVVDGTLTASGKPLLANDPHLATQLPSLWYLAHISAGGVDVIGATLPGAPAVVIGRNRSIAWGVTNVVADVEDLYREKLDASGRNAEFRGAMAPIAVLTETIKVKGAADVRVDVRTTRHGPLVSDAINANNAVAEGAPGSLEPMAFRWTALDAEDRTIVSFLRLNEARNWTDFTEALKDFSVPSQNFVYADVDGHIGYYAPGRIPIRAQGDGLVPAEGWTGEMEWTGSIPFEDLPHAYDPPDHFIVTANNRPMPPDYKYWIGAEFHEPYRARRITDLVRQSKTLSPDSFRSIQSDTVSLHGETLLPLLLEHVKPIDAADERALSILRLWNFNATADSAATAIFQAWFLRLAPTLVEQELGPALSRSYEQRFTFITRFVMAALRDGSSFCSRADVADAKRRSCDTAVSEAFHDGVQRLTAALGPDMSRWRWDTVHRTVFPHQAFDTVAGLRWFFSRSIANQGDWSTVNVGAVNVARPYDQTEIPGYREIVDLSPANDSRFLASAGQSGHFLSPHYDDQLSRWRTLSHLPMQMDREAIERASRERLRLVPSNLPHDHDRLEGTKVTKKKS